MLLVSPRGDFPLNDDWVYAKMVQALTERGHLGFSPLSNALAITQTLYAAPLVKLFGFSFSLLRLTTIFMAWVTVVAVALTARELGLSTRSALLAAMTVFVNPLFINLSYTFMTDIPFCAFASVSTYYFVKAMRVPATKYLLLGTAFSILAFYNRQFGALIPLAFVVAATANWSISRAHFTLRNVAAFTLPWIAVSAFSFYLRVPPSQHLLVNAPPPIEFESYLIRSGVGTMASAFFIGIGLAPLGWSILAKSFKLQTRAMLDDVFPVLSTSLVAALMATRWLLLQVYDGVFPMLRLIEDTGVGVAAFRFMGASWALPSTMAFAMPTVMLIALCFVFCVPALTVLSILIHSRGKAPRIRRSQQMFLLLTSAGLLFAPAVASPGSFLDRYYVAAAPTLALLAVGMLAFRPKRLQLHVGVVVVSILFTVSVIALQDYMAWNHARWQAIDLLREKYGAHDFEINAGYEFNGMYTSDEFLRRSREEKEELSPKPLWVIGEKFAVSPASGRDKLPQYEVIDQVRYFSWLGFTTRYMFVLVETASADDVKASP